MKEITKLEWTSLSDTRLHTEGSLLEDCKGSGSSHRLFVSASLEVCKKSQDSRIRCLRACRLHTVGGFAKPAAELRLASYAGSEKYKSYTEEYKAGGLALDSVFRESACEKKRIVYNGTT